MDSKFDTHAAYRTKNSFDALLVRQATCRTKFQFFFFNVLTC